MPRIVCLIVLSFALVYGEWQVRRAKEDEYPFQVSVKDLRSNVSLCSGVLITPKAVVAPASCITSDRLVKVSAGSIFRKKQNETLTCTNITVHSGYKGSAHNIAIIALCRDFPLNEYIRPAKIPVQDTPLSTTANLSGWNIVDPDDSLRVIVNYTMYEDCKERYNLSTIGDDEFCGEYTLGSNTGGLISSNGVVYGLLTDMNALKKIQRFVKISEHAIWIREILEDEASNIKWYETGSNHTNLASKCMTIVLLISILLCY